MAASSIQRIAGIIHEYLQHNRSSMGFHEAALVIGSLARHRSLLSEFPIILADRKTLAGLILRDTVSSILLVSDRTFANHCVSTISRHKCKLSPLSHSAALVEPAIQSPCFAARGNVVNRKNWIPCISDRIAIAFHFY